MCNEAYMSNEQLIEELKKRDPKAKVLINIKQFNRAYGITQLPVIYNPITKENHITAQYTGCTITVWLPEGGYIAGLNKKKK